MINNHFTNIAVFRGNKWLFVSVHNVDLSIQQITGHTLHLKLLFSAVALKDAFLSLSLPVEGDVCLRSKWRYRSAVSRPSLRLSLKCFSSASSNECSRCDYWMLGVALNLLTARDCCLHSWCSASCAQYFSHYTSAAALLSVARPPRPL